MSEKKEKEGRSEKNEEELKSGGLRLDYDAKNKVVLLRGGFYHGGESKTMTYPLNGLSLDRFIEALVILRNKVIYGDELKVKASPIEEKKDEA